MTIQQTGQLDPLVGQYLYNFDLWRNSPAGVAETQRIVNSMSGSGMGMVPDLVGPPKPADTIYPESAFDPLQVDGNPPATSWVWLAAIGVVLYFIVR